MKENLTEEEKKLIPVIKEKWIAKLTDKKLDEVKLRAQIKWLYKYCNLPEAEITIVDSPLSGQYLANLLADNDNRLKLSKKLVDSGILSDTLKICDKAFTDLKLSGKEDCYQEFAEKLDSETIKTWNNEIPVIEALLVKKPILSKLMLKLVLSIFRGQCSTDKVMLNAEQLCEALLNTQLEVYNLTNPLNYYITGFMQEATKQVLNNKTLNKEIFFKQRSAISKIILDAVKTIAVEIQNMVPDIELKYNDFSLYGNVSDYSWVAFYDFFTEINVLKNDDYNNFRDLMDNDIYDMIQFDKLCIVCRKPTKISRGLNNALHCEIAPAIAWEDGFKLFYWNGISVPEKLIMHPDSITKEEIMNVTNAEQKRCYMEKIGAKNYYEKAYGGVVEIDTDIDDQGNAMTLYRTKEKDDVINEYLQFIEVICPSTGRVYNIYHPKQDCTNVWQAKASTFSEVKIQLRHGDVGLQKIGQDFDKPIMET